MGIGSESQLWHVSLYPSGMPSRLYLQARLPHSSLHEGQAILMGYRLALDDRSLDLRNLYKYPEGTFVHLHKDTAAACQELVAINNLGFVDRMMGLNTPLSPTEEAQVNPNPGINPTLTMLPGLENPQFPTQVSPGLNQEYLATGLDGTEGIPSSSVHHSQVETTSGLPMPMDTSNLASDEVEMWMGIDNVNPTEAQVKAFTSDFRKNGAGKGARVVICLHCSPDDERRVITDLRPWSLARHLVIDFGIKSFHCNECNPPRGFTFKDQLGRHASKCHHAGPSRRN
ncbi:hypothetical protein B0J17DRAFT_680535 [Rhizoctonia solani]|nr:hypothetical protein B0J17DRAFT_680535 [Rhizoctonia solani]